MCRHLLLVLMLLAPCLAAVAANTTVVIDGKAVSVPVIEADGKAFVDVVALMKLLGGNAVYEPAGGKLTITTSGQAATSAAAPGTPQMPGDNGELGQVYALGKDDPLYFRLKSAEFTTAPVAIGEALHALAAGEKLLVLHFTIQNPQKTGVSVRGDSLKFTVVDAMNVNHEAAEDWGDPQSRNRVDLTLEPAQTIEAYAVITVPAKGQVPKLIVQPWEEENAPVLRYDLRGKVTALQAPVADPADPTGSTALEQVPAQANTAYPCKSFDIAVEKFEYATTALDADAPADEGRFLVVTLMMKNESPMEALLRSDTISPVLTSTDGEELTYEGMLLASANRAFDQGVKAGQETRVRIYFTVPKGSTPETLALREDDSRTYEYPVTE